MMVTASVVCVWYIVFLICLSYANAIFPQEYAPPSGGGATYFFSFVRIRAKSPVRLHVSFPARKFVGVQPVAFLKTVLK